MAFANTTIRIAFFVAKPTKTMKPTWTKILMSDLTIHTPASEASKHIGTIKEVKARGGPVIAVTNADLPDDLADAVIRVPRNEPELDPILLTIPLQLFAYHLAIKLGRDIDKPRNLAKSVTVE